MVQVFTSSYSYDYDFATCSLAFFLRYPNPFSSHVVSTDVVSRHVDQQGRLHTVRLVKKRGRLPAWSTSLLGKINESFIIESSVVDPTEKIMHTYSRNLDHTKILKVEEFVNYSSKDDETTNVNTRVLLTSSFGFGIRQRIESWAQKRFGENSIQSRQGMTLVMIKLREHRMRLKNMQIAMHDLMQNATAQEA